MKNVGRETKVRKFMFQSETERRHHDSSEDRDGQDPRHPGDCVIDTGGGAGAQLVLGKPRLRIGASSGAVPVAGWRASSVGGEDACGAADGDAAAAARIATGISIAKRAMSLQVVVGILALQTTPAPTRT